MATDRTPARFGRARFGTFRFGTSPSETVVITPPPPPNPNGYFLPPAYKRYPPPSRELGLLRQFLWDWVGRDITIGGVEYRAAHWNGPLSGEEIDAITAAGLADRIQYADPIIGIGSLKPIDQN